jgi:peptidoglycan/LPS O-acetylase OafA/YrhL
MKVDIERTMVERVLNRNRVIAVDGLRGLAAVNVSIHHFLGAFLPSIMYRNSQIASPEAVKSASESAWWFKFLDFPLLSIFYNGHFPVLIFFVLSGYVLAAPYYEGNDQALRNRFWGRYIRLNAPIAVATVLSFCIYSFGFYYNQNVGALTGDIWIAGFFQNSITWFDAIKIAFYGSLFFGDAQLNAPVWSIRVEFIGSMFLLVFYLAKPNRLLIPVLMFAASLLVLLGQQGVNALLIFLGALMHQLPRPNRTKILAIGSIGIYLGCYKFNSIFYDFLPSFLGQNKNFYNAIGALCISYAALNGYGAKLLESKIAQYLGEISYSLYLTHFILLCSVFSLIFLALPSGPMSVLALFAIYLPVTFLFAQVFNVFVDKPAIQLSRRFAKYVRASDN